MKYVAGGVTREGAVGVAAGIASDHACFAMVAISDWARQSAFSASLSSNSFRLVINQALK
jgi:hypothetical protein